jgi:outer membrane protein TolC
MNERHEPTPEFRAFLEAEIAMNVRRQARAASWAPPDTRRFRTPALVLTAFLVGAAAVSVPAQVEEAKQREALTAASRVEEQLAATRLDLARAALDEARRKFEVGVMPRTSLAAAEAEVQAMESSLARIRLNQEEIRATAAPPRDEITAPLVGSRDFVSDRLQLDLRAAQQRLSSLEAGAAEIERRFEVGTASPLAVLEAQTEVAHARGNLQVLSGRLGLRRDFLKQALAAADAERRLQRLELVQQADTARRLLDLAKKRVEQLRSRFEVGQAERLDVMRAEVELLERETELQMLSRRLEQLGASGRGREQ